ncbi:uncharacterized protein B0H18DRAFT_1027168, partial [Fomitopsis serialis]|uniref:uncharacterized protein n=1 Tax=Fomitopsis serialis TaxID=139415 RepID=UPI002008B04A
MMLSLRPATVDIMMLSLRPSSSNWLAPAVGRVCSRHNRVTMIQILRLSWPLWTLRIGIRSM